MCFKILSQTTNPSHCNRNPLSHHLDAGVSNLLVPLGHTLNTQTLMKTDDQKKKKGPCIIFISATTDKQKSPHT